MLLVPRGLFAYQLAYQHERCGILESSFFSKVGDIKRKDNEAFVLFEPRKSADLYISIQPFFGMKMVPITVPCFI